MKNTYRLNTLLAAVTGLALLAYLIIQSYFPAAILPQLDLMFVCGVSLVSLVLDRYLGKPVNQRNWPVTALLSALTFVVLPLAAGLLSAQELLRFALVSWISFLVLAFLFTTVCERLASGPAGKVAPLLCAGVLFLAVQGCSNLFL